MNKRESSADLRHGFNASGRRSSVDDFQPRVTNVIRRKPGARNVHPTSSYKSVPSRAATQRDGTNVSANRRSSVIRNETTKLPKTRFDSVRRWNIQTPRPRHFPAESVRETLPSWSYSPLSLDKIADQSMCKPVARLSTGPNANACVSNLSDHKYGDTLELGPANALVLQQRQGQQIQQSPEHVVTISQQRMPSMQNVNRTDQSEAILNGRLPSGKRIHRPCVPIAVRRMSVGNLTPRKSAISLHSPDQQSDALHTDSTRQLQQEQASPITAGRTQRTQVPVCQHVSLISRELTADQLRNKVPWKVDDPLNVYDDELQPVGGRKATTGYLSFSPNEKLEAQRRVFVVVPATGLGQESCEPLSVQQRGKDPKQQPYQQQYDQRQQQQQQQQQGQVNQGSGRLGLNYIRQPPQNVQQMYQQLQNNMIRQREIQREALGHQEQMMVLAEQRMRQRSLAHRVKTAVQQVQSNGESDSNQYNSQEISGGQQPDTIQDIYTDKISIPHHRMLMEQQHAGHGSAYANPKHGWMPYRDVIGHNSSANGQSKQFAVEPVSPEKESMLSNDTKRYEQLKQIEAVSIENQTRLRQQADNTQWQQSALYSQYEAAQQYRPIQHVQCRPNPLSYRRYPPVQPRWQGSDLQPRSSPIQHRSRQQQPEIIKSFHPPVLHRVLQTAKTKYPQFTVEMIRDQELLVANMRQQKIPQDVMRRQFNALLYEQRRLLASSGEQELKEELNDTMPCRSSRDLQNDHRPDWMVNITPARHFGDEVNRQGTQCEQRPRQTVPEEIKQHDRTHGEIIRHMGNDSGSQYALNSPYLFHNPHCQEACQLRKQQACNEQYGTRLQASTPCITASLPHIVSPPQGTWNWPQQYHGPKSGPQCLSVRYNDSQARLPQQQPRQQSLQRQYIQEHEQNRLQQLYHTQRQPSMNSTHQRAQQGVCITPEKYQRRKKMMPERINEECDGHSSQRRNEPWSLLKLREFKRYVRSQRQNNGLQDAEAVNAATELTHEAREGLEYVANLEKKVTALKLNGTQDPSESENISETPVECLQRMQERQRPTVSSNGLCNTRNANNPAPPPISFPRKIDPSPMDGYPRQHHPGEKLPRANMAQNTHKIISEKENGSVAVTTHEDHRRTILMGHNQSVEQYQPTQSTTRDQYLPWQRDSVNGRYRRSTITCDEKNPIRSERPTLITPYKFDGPVPLYHQQIEQFYHNRLNLRNVDQSGTGNLSQRPGTLNEIALARQVSHRNAGNTIQYEASSTNANTCVDQGDQQKSRPAGETADHTYTSCSDTRLAENKESIPRYLAMQQTTADSNHGQPEIREPRTIGGLVYLARKPNYIRNSPLIAPNASLTSEFLQPFVSGK